MQTRIIGWVGLTACLVAGPVWTQVDEADSGATFDQVSASAKADLDRVLTELSELQRHISEERVPLARALNDAEARVIERRKEYDRLQRAYENQLVDLNVLKAGVKREGDQVKFLESMLNEYVRVFETRIHISEVARYQEGIDTAKLAPGLVDLTPAQTLERQMALMETAVRRIENLMGGESFAGRGLTPQGVLEEGTFIRVGPVAAFASGESGVAGVSELQLGSPEPTVIDVGEAHAAGIREVASGGAGMLPVDPTMGNALKIRATKDTLVGHVRKGGPVMVPILLLGFTALFIAFYKWWELARIRIVGPLELQNILNHINSGRKEKAREFSRTIKGPVGDLLSRAIEALGQKKEYLEEIMYEKMLTTKPRLERLLPMIALTAATAPLLGLLGTVTGMINTFNMITIFGTGDPKTLAGGISEALVTTEFGLIVAVPALLLHAFVSRKAKSILGSMEQTTVAFINGVPSEGEAPMECGKEESEVYVGNVY